MDVMKAEAACRAQVLDWSFGYAVAGYGLLSHVLWLHLRNSVSRSLATYVCCLIRERDRKEKEAGELAPKFELSDDEQESCLTTCNSYISFNTWKL